MVLVFAPFSFLIAAALVLSGIRLFKPNFAYGWLVTSAGTLAAFGFLIGTKTEWSSRTLQLAYTSQPGFLTNLTVLFDLPAWTFSLAAVTVLLATLLTGFSPGVERGWKTTSGFHFPAFLSLTAFCALSTTAGNLILFQILWMVIDVIELTVWVKNFPPGSDNRSLMKIYGLKAASHMLTSSAAALTLAGGASVGFSTLPASTIPLLVIAAALRLGLAPPYIFPARAIPIDPLQRPMLFLVAATPSIILLVRASSIPMTAPASSILIILATLALLSAGFSWLSKPDLSLHPHHWVQAAGSLVVVSALSGLSDAAIAWGAALLLLGGSVFNYHIQEPPFRPFIWLGSLSLTSLPFTLTWSGSQLYTMPALTGFLLVIGQSLLAGCFFIFSLHKSRGRTSYTERWIKPVYALGLAFPILTAIYLSISNLPLKPDLFLNIVSNIDWFLPGLIIAGFSTIIVFSFWIKPRVIILGSTKISRLLEFSWLEKLLGFAAGLINKGLHFTAILLEGQAGIIWAVLLLVLLITLLQQSGMGGG